MLTIQCANREAATHNGIIVTKCFKQSSLLTRKYLVSTSTLMKTYKPLAVHGSHSWLSDGVVEAMKASDGKTLGGHDLTAALSVACSNQLKQYRWKPIQGIEEAFRFRVANVSARRIRRA